ncbi:hypothetical protein RCH18_000639 [Flavobacterium sp. PL11]|jgi:hypothetical protein|uniref:hypothetical protein n=1 Tax=Flavobacterium sp. PL11 TaxID=3071717 RepID=UPI002E0BB9D9|nr:hypothetical protein [Flavobacterium sp. PL11]
MNIPKELINGFIIFLGIGLFFLLAEALGLADNYLLRFFNVAFIFYGTLRTLRSNYKQGDRSLPSNASSAVFTAFSGIFLSVIGLVIYITINGGDAYIESLSRNFLFGGTPSVIRYAFSLLLEGFVSAGVVSFLMILYWETKYKSDKHGAKK